MLRQSRKVACTVKVIINLLRVTLIAMKVSTFTMYLAITVSEATTPILTGY